MLDLKLAADQLAKIIWPECRKWLTNPFVGVPAHTAFYESFLKGMDEYWNGIVRQAGRSTLSFCMPLTSRIDSM